MSRSRVLRALAVVIVAALVPVLPLTAGTTPVAASDLGVLAAPDRQAPAYEPQALRTWEVRGVHPDSTFPLPVLVWDMVELDGVMYVGGRFLTVRRGPGFSQQDQPFLAAFDSATGEWIDTFRPRLDGVVHAVAVSPNRSRLLVGGEFTSVNGDAAAAGLVALDPLTGEVDPGWTATVSHMAGQTPVVMDIEVVGQSVFVGGTFTHIEGPNGAHRARVWRLAKLEGASGRVDTSFRGQVSGARVFSLGASPDGQRLYVGGYFQVVNGVDTKWFATLDTSTGDFAPVAQGLPPAPQPIDRVTPVFDIEATADRVFLASDWHYLHVLDATTNERHYLYWAGGQGGDFQALKLVDDVLWAGGHNHGFMVPTAITDETDMVYHRFVNTQGWEASPRVPVQWVSAHDAATGRALRGFVPRLNMSDGVWAIEMASNGNLWVAGDATRSGRVSVGGFAVFRPSAPGDEVNLAVNGTATQSSLYSCCTPARHGSPEKAIDRMTTGNFQEESSSRTLRETEPWWELDLGSAAAVSLIRVWPLTHDGGFRNWERVAIPPMHVFVSAEPFESTDLAGTAAQPGVTRHVIDSFADVYEEIVIDDRIRYVRIQAPGVAQLGLAEVEVIGGGPAPGSPSPPSPPSDQELVGAETMWRYWDTPTNPPAGWSAPGFDDAGWSQGPAKIGFGGRGEVTVINGVERPGRSLESAFFRTTFSVSDPASITELELSLLADDGAIVYLNGTEVVRDNVPATGRGYRLRSVEVRYGAAERAYRSFTLPTGLLNEGDNVVAIEVHNHGWWSLDLTMDAVLRAR